MTPRDSSPLGFRRTGRFLAAPGVLLLALMGASAVPVRAEMDDNPSYLKDWVERDKGSGWNFSPALNGGYTS
ncbi:MAG TPA: hypothetical protein PKA08_09435, partial [Elusimicrobiota bacterium]|nr:hypothetical protein [Elusimicrobiota bacterium]